MSDKELGTNVTYLDPENKSYETVVFRQDKPLSHAELGLLQDLQGQARTEALRRIYPSGFLSGDFLDDSTQDFVFGTNANELNLNGLPVAHVNGWVLPLEYTETTSAGENVISLDAPSSQVGDFDADFVYLEVWRALIEPDPSTTNKPAADKIYPGGNVLAPMSTWLDDDLLDTPVAIANGIETTRRVQIQYAIRKTRLADRNVRDGYPDANVEVQGPNGSPLAGETFSKSATDPGLWVGGDEIGSGNEIAGTVDGFVYSIPIALVYRRNSAGFDFLNNGNGGINEVATATPSDRPDGYFSDQVTLDDVQDLRSGVYSSPEWNRITEKSASLLLDNSLRSWAMDAGHADWIIGGQTDSVGTRLLIADDLRPSSPTTTGGNEFRNPDGVCRVYSDRAHHEPHVEVYSTGGTWAEDDPVSFSLPAEAPADAFIFDVTAVQLTTSGVGIVDMPVKSVSGLGTDSVTVTLDVPPASYSDDLWVEYEVLYPKGLGLTALFDEQAQNNPLDAIIHDPTTFTELPVAYGVNDASTRADARQYLEVDYEDGPHREVTIQHHGPDESINTYIDNGKFLLLPDIPLVEDPTNPDADITVNIGGVESIANVEGRTIELVNSFADGTTATVDYTPLEPIPADQTITFYYFTPALQAIPRDYLDNPSVPSTNELNLEILHIPDHMYSCTASSGSDIDPFPYIAPSNQIPVSGEIGGTSYEGEHDLNAPGNTSIDDFDADVGMLRLQTLVPTVHQDSLTLIDPVSVSGGSLHTHPVDHFQNSADSVYKPSSFAQSLSSEVEHKTFVPILARLKEDTEFGRAGTVVLVVLTQYFDSANTVVSSQENRIAFDNINSCASVYKVKGNILTRS